MPFFDGDCFHVYYLKDRHGHRSKWGLGAHQFAHISSEDLIHWTNHPLAVEITHPWEGSICTGSILKEKDLYYAFYAVRMSDRTAAQVSWAVSRDGIHFEKSEQYLCLKAPYESVSARDPEVFKDSKGIYHMLLTTDFLDAEVMERRGCLAHLISTDLKNWEQRMPFLVPGYTDQPECSDYFEWNGWYYLIFSNYGFAKYRYSREPFGTWIKPEVEVLDGHVLRVPKTGEFYNGRRILTGFLPNAADGKSYGGNLVFRELIQHKDGTLGTCHVSEMLPKLKGNRFVGNIFEKKHEEYRIIPLMEMEDCCLLKVTICRKEKNAVFGFLLHQKGKRSYEIRIEPSNASAGIYIAHSNPFERQGWELTHFVTELEVEVCILLSHDILDCCFNRDRTLICRLEDWQEGKNCLLEGFVIGGSADFYIHD